MRIKETKEEISYVDTQEFFRNRAKNYNNDTPYVTTMYNDKHPELVKERNEIELRKLLPFLQLDEKSRILDVSCGIGRWAEAITTKIDKYCGIDFCEDFIELAKKRNFAENKEFLVGRSSEISRVLQENNVGKFNRVIVVGALMYLNDNDMESCLSQIEASLENEAVILIREPIGLNSRLTLKEEFSSDMDTFYNAIYRTRDELKSVFEDKLISKGFKILQEAFLFDDTNLNNRKETTQYYFILQRK